MDENASLDVKIKTELIEAKSENTDIAEVQIVANSKKTRQKGFKIKLEKRSKYPLQQCKICNKSVRKMYLHLKRVHFEEIVPRVCDICQKTFLSEFNLKMHIKVHKLLQSCPVCQKNVRHLNQHINYNHRSDGEPRICDICEESFLNIEKFKYHIKKHNSLPVQVCKVCKKSVRHLNAHMKYNHRSDSQQSSPEKEQHNVPKRNRRRGA